MGIQSRNFARRFTTHLIFLSVLTIPQVVFAWGHTGHIIIADVGSTLARTPVPFFKANLTNMTNLTNVPDDVWKTLPTSDTEKPTHFFQPDSYYQNPSQFSLIPQQYSAAVAQFTESMVDASGTSVWRAQQFYNLAVAAIRANDFKTGLEMAGAMSHYIGDMSQPLHDSANYDGQMTGQSGIHMFFETTNINNANASQLLTAVGQAATALVNNAQFVAQFQGSLSQSIFNEVWRSYALKNTLLSIDKTQGRTGAGATAQLNLAVSRMADGAATLAIILTHLWADAGNPNYGTTVSVSVPSWVAPNYQSLFQTNAVTYNVDDDCLL